MAQKDIQLLSSMQLTSGEFVHVGAREVDWPPALTRDFFATKFPRRRSTVNTQGRDRVEEGSAVLIGDVHDGQPLHLARRAGAVFHDN